MDPINVDTTARPSHKIPCTPDQSKQTACLNGGVCKAIPSYGGGVEIFCQCTSEWEGRRCELVRFEPIPLVNSSMIVGIVAAIVILIIIGIILVILFIRIRKRRRGRRGQSNTNNITVTVQNQDSPHDNKVDEALLNKNGTQFSTTTV